MALLPYVPPAGGDPQGLRDLFLYGTLTQGFGHTSFEYFHDGFDIVPSNSYAYGDHPPVPSLVSGTVIYRDWDPLSKQDPQKGYGKKVAIQDAQGDVFWAGHLNDFFQLQRPGTPPDPTSELQVGQKVYAGDTIGHMDSTGDSTGPHIHYGIHDQNGYPIDVTLGGPPVVQVNDYGIKTNILYAYMHDLGFGAGDNQGNQQKWAQSAPPPGYSDAPVGERIGTQSSARSNYGRAVGILDANPGNPYGQSVPTPPAPYPHPIGQPVSQPGSGGCLVGTIAPKNPDGSCPAGFAPQIAGGMDTQCVCITNNGGLPVPSLPDIGGAIQAGIFTLGVAAVGFIFIAAGLWALMHEGPVNAVTAPVVAGTRAIVRTGAKVGALAA